MIRSCIDDGSFKEIIPEMTGWDPPVEGGVERLKVGDTPMLLKRREIGGRGISLLGEEYRQGSIWITEVSRNQVESTLKYISYKFYNSYGRYNGDNHRGIL